MSYIFSTFLHIFIFLITSLCLILVSYFRDETKVMVRLPNMYTASFVLVLMSKKSIQNRTLPFKMFGMGQKVLSRLT